MARACRFTAPYGSREIHHDGKPFIEIHRALNKHGTGSSRPVDVDDTAREILALLCGTRKRKSALAGSRLRDGAPAAAPAPAAPKAAAPAAAAVAGWWPFSKKAPKKLPRDPRKMAQTVMFTPGAKGMSSRGEMLTMRGAKRRRRRR
jgi:hypothetical protein